MNRRKNDPEHHQTAAEGMTGETPPADGPSRQTSRPPTTRSRSATAHDSHLQPKWLLLSGVILCIALAGLIGYYLSQPADEPSQALRALAADENEDDPDAAAMQLPTERPDARSGPSQPLPLRVPPPESVEGLIDEAREVAEHLVQQFPQNPDAFEMVGRFQSWLGETASAASAWETCLELEPTYNYALHGLASIATQRGEHEKAAEFYRQALVNDNRCSKSQIELAKSLLALGEVDEAVSLLTRKVRTNPRSIEGFVQLGMAYLQQQQYEKAKLSYESAVRIHPAHSAAHFGLATAYTRLGDEKQAQRHRDNFQALHSAERDARSRDRIQFDDLRATREDIATMYIGMGQVYLTQGDATAAEQLWERAAVLDPQDIDSRQARAWLYLQQGKPLETIRMLGQLAELDPQEPSYPIEIARLYVTLNRPSDAERTLKKLCETVPADDAGPAALAQFYIQTNQKLDEAITLSQTAVELAPVAENYVLLGAAYERSERWEEAVEAIENALQLEPGNPQIQRFRDLLQEKADGK